MHKVPAGAVRTGEKTGHGIEHLADGEVATCRNDDRGKQQYRRQNTPEKSFRGVSLSVAAGRPRASSRNGALGTPVGFSTCRVFYQPIAKNTEDRCHTGSHRRDDEKRRGWLAWPGRPIAAFSRARVGGRSAGAGAVCYHQWAIARRACSLKPLRPTGWIPLRPPSAGAHTKVRS